jgi:hypothetical protein
VIWNIFAKFMKEIRKAERKRSKEGKNMKMDPGKRFGPEQKRAHGPLGLKPETVSYPSLPLADM